MVTTRNKKYVDPPPPPPQNETIPVSHVFEALVSAAANAPDGLKPPLLEKLYRLLGHLSTQKWSCQKVGSNLDELEYQLVPSGIRLTSKDMCRLSEILFKGLCHNFKQLLSALHVGCASRADRQPVSHPDMLVSAAELNLLLRCCLKMLDVTQRQHIIVDNGQFLLVIVRTLVQLASQGETGISLEHSYSCTIDHGNNSSSRYCTKEFVASMSLLKLTDSCIPILSSIVEVFVDELMVSVQLRRYFSIIDSTSTREILSMDFLGDCELKIVMELLCTHFFLFVSKEQEFEFLLSRLSWPLKDFLASEVSLSAALWLLQKPLLLSVPKLMQTHIYLLISEAIGFSLDFYQYKPDVKLIDQYLSIFERSVGLYTHHIAKLQVDVCPDHCKFCFLQANISGQFFQPLESYVQPVTKEKISHLNTNFRNLWNSYFRNRFVRSKGDLTTAAIAILKENLCIFDKSYREEIQSVLICIMTRVCDDIGSVAFDACDDANIQDVCFLASLTNLMSISLLQSLWCLQSLCMGCPTTTFEKLSSCKEYDFIIHILDCFVAQDIMLPIENSFCTQIESQSTKHKKSKLMLFHFLRLLSFSFSSGVDFLVKGCILCIVAIVNLSVFEEGNLDALKSIVDIGSQFPQQGARGHNKSSLVVAAKFQKMQAMYLSKDPPANHKATEGQLESCSLSCDPGNMDADNTVEETCNGVNFLRYNGGKSSDLNDLADFIECKQGKDYRAWLKDKEKYRKYRNVKQAALSWKKKKQHWTLMKGKNIKKSF